MQKLEHTRFSMDERVVDKIVIDGVPCERLALYDASDHCHFSEVVSAEGLEAQRDREVGFARILLRLGCRGGIVSERVGAAERLVSTGRVVAKAHRGRAKLSFDVRGDVWRAKPQ